MKLEVSFLIEDEESIWDGVKEILEKVRWLIQSSTKTESSIPLLPSSKENKSLGSNIKCNPLSLWKEKENWKKQSCCSKRKKNSTSAIGVLMPADTETIVEEIDENFNKSASDEFDNNLNSSTKVNPIQDGWGGNCRDATVTKLWSHQHIYNIIWVTFVGDVIV